MLLKIMQKRLSETFCMQILMYTAEDWLLSISKYGIKCIEKLQSHCANMTFADKSRYDRTFQKVTHKGGESAVDYIKMFHNAQDL